MGHLWDALCRGFDVLGFDQASGGDEVFRQLVLARIIEPTSKLDSLRVLAEVGIETVVSDAEPAPTGLREGRLAAGAGGGMCRAREAGAGQPGALRRDHLVLRDRRR
jgi:hypothetical protein